jgi:hypothetical protein
MRTAAQRIAKYNARMLSSLVDPTLSAVNAQQQANFAIYQQDFYPKQVQLRSILSGYSMPAPMIFGFEAFHGELYHLSKVASGDILLAGATMLVTKWSDTAHLGAGNADVLKAIALAIYTLIIP